MYLLATVILGSNRKKQTSTSAIVVRQQHLIIQNTVIIFIYVPFAIVRHVETKKEVNSEEM